MKRSESGSTDNDEAPGKEEKDGKEGEGFESKQEKECLEGKDTTRVEEKQPAGLLGLPYDESDEDD